MGGNGKDSKKYKLMIIVKISDVKDFMKKLFLKEIFDNFLLVSTDIKTASDFKIDGKRNKEWYDEENEADTDYIKWKEVREQAAFLIKGERPPLFIKSVFRLSEENTAKLAVKADESADIKSLGMFFTLKFDGKELFITTGVSYYDFLKTKRFEEFWNENLLKFLKYFDIYTEKV